MVAMLYRLSTYQDSLVIKKHILQCKPALTNKSGISGAHQAVLLVAQCLPLIHYTPIMMRA